MTGRSMRGMAIRAAAAGLLGLLLNAGGAVVLGADHGVDIAGFAFSPGSITVAVGDTVTWTNADAQTHTATADDGSFDTGTIAGSTSKTVTFSTAGTFAYHCKIHRSMTATIVVEAAAGATSPPTDTVGPVTPAGRSDPSSGERVLLAAAAVGSVVLAWRRFRGVGARRED
jgi:plastocyanin